MQKNILRHVSKTKKLIQTYPFYISLTWFYDTVIILKIVAFNILWNNCGILIRIPDINWIYEGFEQNYVKVYLTTHCVLFCKKLDLSYVQPSKFYYSNTNKDCTL